MPSPDPSLTAKLEALRGEDGVNTAVRNNLGAVRRPVPTDDADARWAAGSAWFYPAMGEVWFCVDAAPGNAIWVRATGIWGVTPEDHATSHQDGGTDEIATATPGPGDIPKADADGTVREWVPGSQTKQGYDLHTDGTPAVTTTYDPATRKVTVTAKVGATFDVFVGGVRYTMASPHVSEAHADTDGLWFYYWTGSAWTWHQTPWDIMTTAPTCAVYWNVALADGIALLETHTVSRDPAMHRLMHLGIGTQLGRGGVVSGYVLNGDTDDSVRFGVEETLILDEDLASTLAVLADNGTSWPIIRRTGATGVWTWATSLMPYLYGTYPQFNHDPGGGWVMADLAGNKFVTYYLIAVPALDADYRFLLLPGQVQYDSLAEAQAEQFSDVVLGDIFFPEFVPIAQLVYQSGAAYGTTGKGRVQSVSRIVGTRSSIAAGGIPSHNSLTGLQGGAPGDYYHLTFAEYTALIALLP